MSSETLERHFAAAGAGRTDPGSSKRQDATL
jgi:hypothetical protein